tara:strand:+ start:19282 stop:20169 length:888 start_codon:yes stop_codon:yes gene_type:complete
MTKILLYGATGNLGSILLDRLIKQNHFVTSIGRKKILDVKNFIELDFFNKNKLDTFSKNISKHDVLIFLIGLAHFKGRKRNLKNFRLINRDILVEVLKSLNRYQKVPEKIIFSSTISVYGENLKTTFYSEATSLKANSPYAITKIEAEDFLQKYYKNKSWVLRFAPVYSPHFQLNIDRRTKVLSTFYKVGKGMNKLSLCNIENIVYSINAIINDEVPKGIYNISDKIDYKYSDLLNFRKATYFFRVPKIFIKMLYFFGKGVNHIFLKENCIKLLSDNIYPSDKIRKFIDLPYKLY